MKKILLVKQNRPVEFKRVIFIRIYLVKITQQIPAQVSSHLIKVNRRSIGKTAMIKTNIFQTELIAIVIVCIYGCMFI